MMQTSFQSPRLPAPQPPMGAAAHVVDPVVARVERFVNKSVRRKMRQNDTQTPIISSVELANAIEVRHCRRVGYVLRSSLPPFRLHTFSNEPRAPLSIQTHIKNTDCVAGAAGPAPR
jgi:hypothetical protein